MNRPDQAPPNSTLRHVARELVSWPAGCDARAGTSWNLWRDGGFLKGTPKWMCFFFFFFFLSPTKYGWFGGSPILRNLHIIELFYGNLASKIMIPEMMYLLLVTLVRGDVWLPEETWLWPSTIKWYIYMIIWLYMYIDRSQQRAYFFRGLSCWHR